MNVLLVEDEDLLRELVLECLETAGHVVQAFPSPELALRRSSGQSFDLLITDLVMPGLSGAELADRVRLAQPRCRVIFMSGFTDKPPHAGSGVFLRKPFTPLELSRAVDEALGETPTPRPSG
jgi:CheY-like chemotaxis protein